MSTVTLSRATQREIAAWLLSSIGGLFAVLAFVALGTRGLAVAALLSLMTAIGPRRRLRAGGALAGSGAATLVILAVAMVRCAELSTYLASNCAPVSLTFAIPFALLTMLMGATFAVRELAGA